MKELNNRMFIMYLLTSENKTVFKVSGIARGEEAKEWHYAPNVIHKRNGKYILNFVPM